MNAYTVDIEIDPTLGELLAAEPEIAAEVDWLADDARVAEYLRELVCFLLAEQGVRDCAEVSVMLAAEDWVHELNRDHRGVDSATDVLSFPCDDPESPELVDDEAVLLGDIVIAPTVVFRQSREYGTTFLEELTLLVTHGVLHLLGFDHVEDDEAEVMEARERELRTAWWESRR